MGWKEGKKVRDCRNLIREAGGWGARSASPPWVINVLCFTAVLRVNGTWSKGRGVGADAPQCITPPQTNRGDGLLAGALTREGEREKMHEADLLTALHPCFFNVLKYLLHSEFAPMEGLDFGSIVSPPPILFLML